MPNQMPLKTTNGSQSPLNVLIVEDEVIVSLELHQLLTNLGYNVVSTARTGKDAIEKAQTMDVDLILMDIHLEDDITGIEAAQRIHNTEQIPVIFLTAYSDSQTLQAAKKTSPYGYLLKPFNSESLHTTIEIAINKFKLKQRLQDSYDDLLYILNGLAIGTLMTDSDGKIVFASQVACNLMHMNLHELKGLHWRNAFPFTSSVLEQLAHMSYKSPHLRSKIPARIDHANGTQYRLEIDVRDDPRSKDRLLFVLYDVTEVFGLRRMLDDHAQFHDIIGKSGPMQRVFQQIKQVARVDSTV